MESELEERALAYVLKTEHGMAQLSAYLKPEHFEVEAYRALYQLAQKSWRKRQVVLTDRELLYLTGEASKKAGPVVGSIFSNYIQKVYATDVTAITYDHLVECITRAEFATLAADAVNMPVDEFMDGVKDRLETYHPLLQGGLEQHYHLLEDAYMAAIATTEQDTTGGVKTGFTAIDQMIRGGCSMPGELVEVLALTNSGKTGMMVGGLAKNQVEQGHRVLYFSVDVSKAETETRFWASAAGLSMDFSSSMTHLWARDHRGDPYWLPEYYAQRRRLVAAWRDKFQVAPNAFTCLEIPPLKYNVAGLKQMARQIAQMEGPFSAVYIDYGQQVKATGKYDKKYNEVGDVFAELKAWSIEDKFVLYTAAQVHRRGYEEEIITLRNIAEGFNMTWPAQLVLSLNQSRDERRVDADETSMRVALLKNTKGRSQMVFPFKVNWSCMSWRYDTDGEVTEIDIPKKVSREDKKKREKPEDGDKPLIRRRKDWVPRVGDDDMKIEKGEE